jgi:hypothetical protein
MFKGETAKDETGKDETRKTEISKDETGKPAGAGRLISDLRSAKLELLSAQSATDRLRLQYSVADIIFLGEPYTLRGAIAPANVLCRFFASIEDQMKQAEQPK